MTVRSTQQGAFRYVGAMCSISGRNIGFAVMNRAVPYMGALAVSQYIGPPFRRDKTEAHTLDLVARLRVTLSAFWGNKAQAHTPYSVV